MGQRLSVVTGALGEKHAYWGKHRTEATEVTEGGIGIMSQRLSVVTGAFGRETRVLGKASHRGHRGHRGGNWHYGPEALRGYRGFGRETREKENIGNQRPIAIEELTKRKAARIKHRAVLVG